MKLLLSLLAGFVATSALQHPEALASEQALLALEHGQRGLFGDIASGIGGLFGGPGTPTHTPATTAPTPSKASATTHDISQRLDSESSKPIATSEHSLIDEEQSTGGGLPNSTKIALGVAIPLSLILAAIVAVLFVKLRANKKAQEKYDRQPSIEISEAREELLETIGGAGEVEEYAPPSYTELPENHRLENNKK